MTRRLIPFVFVVMAAVAGPVLDAAAKTAVNAARWTATAIEGTDPVAYFTDGKPVAGSRDFTHEWQGAKWRFASAENRDLFKANPAKYAPQFGGWCAWAVSQGYTASIEPEAWKIVDGKLYLNYSKSVQTQWSQDIPGNIRKGESNWPRISAGLLK